MAIPEANLSIRDGGLGLVESADEVKTQAKIGTCSSGTANTLYTFNDPQTVRDTLGSGPLTEALCHVLERAGGPVYGVKSPSSTAGAASSVTATQTGTATLAVTGASLDAYNVKVVILTGGATVAAGAATFKYTLDGGTTYSPEISLGTSGVYAIPNTGLTLTWTYVSGTAFVAADYFVFTASAPSSTLSEMQAAADVIIQDNTVNPFLIHYVGAAATVSAAATMATAVESKMQTAESTYFRYFRALVECPDDTDANIKAAFVSYAGTRTLIAAGSCYLTSQVSGVAYKRNAAWPASAQAGRFEPHEDLGKVRNGPLRGVVSLVRDEFKTAGLDAAKFLTLRTYQGKRGFFVTNGRIMATAGSDFQYLQYGRVVDVACRTLRAAQLEYLNDDTFVDEATGLILESAAVRIEQDLERQLRTVTTEPGRASSVSVRVDRTVNIISTGQLLVEYRIVPKAYFKQIVGKIALDNPALRAA